jgi:4-diphosphocytidyl-2-C-methyl-D-erythritol kinase
MLSLTPVAHGPERCLALPAPAKLNAFLHVTGRRPDGYHEIESLFLPLDLADEVDLERRSDGRIVREGDLTGPEDEDLAVRAARLLQAEAQALEPARPLPGVTLRVIKRIPVGAGLGGGSSDAATTLIGLNRLWQLGLARTRLAALGLRLGADVPFFLGTGPAFVQGIGERLQPVAFPVVHAVVAYPGVPVATREIFSAPELTRDHKPTTIAGFSAMAADWGRAPLDGSNDLEAVARARCPAVGASLARLAAFGPARMSGSGSAVFCACAGPERAAAIWAELQAELQADLRADLQGTLGPGAQAWAVRTLAELPLAAWLEGA